MFLIVIIAWGRKEEKDKVHTQIAITSTQREFFFCY